MIAATFSPVPSQNVSQGTWPALTNVNGVIEMRQSNFTVSVEQANYKQVALSDFHAEIPNVSAKQLVLTVNGNAKGEASQMLDYLFASPVGKKQSKLEKNLKISGSTNLALGLKIPLSGNDNTATDVQVEFPGNKAQWSDVPPLENLKGKIRITDANPEFENITANFLGGLIKISSAPTPLGNQLVNISGDVSAGFIKSYFAKDLTMQHIPVFQAMSGSAKYEGTLKFNKGASETNLNIDLRNWASTTPAPLKKSMGLPMMGQVTVQTSKNSVTNSSQLS
jgi:uncharacterized protein YhdP